MPAKSLIDAQVSSLQAKVLQMCNSYRPHVVLRPVGGSSERREQQQIVAEEALPTDDKSAVV